MGNKDKIRINRSIRASSILLIDEDGNNCGELLFNDALAQAERNGLDLMEVGNKNGMPVCRILDYGKWKYEQAKRDKGNKQHRQVTKEIKFRPNTSDNDLIYRAKRAEEFLEAGDKVKLVVRFRGRELAHMYDTGAAMLERFVALLGKVPFGMDQHAKVEGKCIALLLSPTDNK